MTNFDKHDMFITVAKAFGNEVSNTETLSKSSNKETLQPASFTNIASMLGAF